MAYIKSLSVHNFGGVQKVVDYVLVDEKFLHPHLTPEILRSAKFSLELNTNALIDYVIDDKKTLRGNLVSAHNCTEDTAAADMEIVQRYKKTKDYNYTSGKKPVKMHHVIQSFKPGETTPELAHKIGVETMLKHFGEDAQILISTHVDQGHIHNHVLVNSVDVRGNKLKSNKESLKNLRGISDEQCLSHGLSVIQKSNEYSKRYAHYGEHKDSQTGDKNKTQNKRPRSSWQDKIRLDIDKAIVASDDYDEFLKMLECRGYEVSGPNRKYLSIKKIGYSKGVRVERLGPEYTTERIKERIADPDKQSFFVEETPVAKPKQTDFLLFVERRRKRYTAANALLSLQYLSVLEMLFRLILNNLFSDTFRWDVRRPYGVFNDYYFAKHLAQLLFLDKNNIKTKEEYVRHKTQWRDHPNTPDEDRRMYNDIDITMAVMDDLEQHDRDTIVPNLEVAPHPSPSMQTKNNIEKGL